MPRARRRERLSPLRLSADRREDHPGEARHGVERIRRTVRVFGEHALPLEAGLR